jgi:hypothetical protein
MKMGTILSPRPYDAAARAALQSENLRHTPGFDRRHWGGAGAIRTAANEDVLVPTTSDCHGRAKTKQQKTNKSARLSRDPGQNFFLSVNYITVLDRFLNDAG